MTTAASPLIGASSTDFTWDAILAEHAKVCTSAADAYREGLQDVNVDRVR
jgi:hypothetical protein